MLRLKLIVIFAKMCANELRRNLVLIGNSYFDQLHFGRAVDFHAQSLLVALGLDFNDATEKLPDVLKHLVNEPPTSESLLMALFNLGNSLRQSRNWLYGPARAAVILGAANLPDLESYASSYEGGFVLSKVIKDIEESFKFAQLPKDFQRAWRLVVASSSKEGVEGTARS